MSYKAEIPKYPPVFFVRITEKMRNLFIHLYRKFTHPTVAVLEMVHNFWLAVAIGVVAELKIADMLKTGPMSIHDLAKSTNTHEESLYRLMRALASNDVFKELKNKIFINTPLSKSLLEDQARYLISFHLSNMNFKLFSELKYTITTGNKASDLFVNENLFEYMKHSNDRSETFDKAMTNSTMMHIAAILPVYSFSRFNKIVDVAGGQGFLLAAILNKYPEISGVVFDQPHAIQKTSEVFEKFDVSPRAEISGGSFFETIPDGGDLYILKNILHDWDDESCLKILGNICTVLPSKARLLIIESVINLDNKPFFGKMTDLLMMVALGGKERTITEFQELLAKSGLKIRKIYRTISPLSLIEVEKDVYKISKQQEII